jgi:putative transposase
MKEAAYARADYRYSEGYEAGMKTVDLCRKHGISEATFYNCRAKHGGLESEKAKLKKLLANAMLNNAALKDLLAKCDRNAGQVHKDPCLNYFIREFPTN